MLRLHYCSTRANGSTPACDPSGACVGWRLTVSRSAKRCGRGKYSAAPTRKQQGREVAQEVKDGVIVGGIDDSIELSGSGRLAAPAMNVTAHHPSATLSSPNCTHVRVALRGQCREKGARAPRRPSGGTAAISVEAQARSTGDAEQPELGLTCLEVWVYRPD